jgi:ketosteroid isomerase-like protein
MKQSTANAQIAAAMEAVRQGLLKRDARIVAGAYAPDAVIFDLAPPLAHSIDVDQLAKWLEGWGGPVDQKLQNFKFTVDGDLAVGHGLIRVSTHTKSGEDAAWWMRATVCLARQSGDWKIVHEHTSVPFYMDGSYRAAIDLSP